MALCRQLVGEGEIRELVAERVWQELSRGLDEAQPSRMFGVLRDCGALAVLALELDRLWGVPQKADLPPGNRRGIHIMQVIDYAANCGWPLATRYAALTHDLGKPDASRHPAAHHAHGARSAKLVDAQRAGACNARWPSWRQAVAA